MSAMAPIQRARLNHFSDSPGNQPRLDAHCNTSPLNPINKTATPSKTTNNTSKNMDQMRMSHGLPFWSSKALSLKPERTAWTLLEA